MQARKLAYDHRSDYVGDEGRGAYNHRSAIPYPIQLRAVRLRAVRDPIERVAQGRVSSRRRNRLREIVFAVSPHVLAALIAGLLAFVMVCFIVYAPHF